MIGARKLKTLSIIFFIFEPLKSIFNNTNTKLFCVFNEFFFYRFPAVSSFHRLVMV